MNIKKYLKNDAGQAKRIILAAVIIFTIIFSNINAAFAQTKTSPVNKKPIAAKVVSKKKAVKSVKATKTVKAVKSTKVAKAAVTKTSLKWTADGLRALGSIASFGYNYSLRNTIIKKVENYARRKNIKVITAAVVNSMDE